MLYPTELRGHSVHVTRENQRNRAAAICGTFNVAAARQKSPGPSAQRYRIDDAEHLGSRVLVADAGIGEVIERQTESRPVVEPVGQLHRRPEF